MKNRRKGARLYELARHHKRRRERMEAGREMQERTDTRALADVALRADIMALVFTTVPTSIQAPGDSDEQQRTRFLNLLYSGQFPFPLSASRLFLFFTFIVLRLTDLSSIRSQCVRQVSELKCCWNLNRQTFARFQVSVWLKSGLGNGTDQPFWDTLLYLCKKRYRSTR